MNPSAVPAVRPDATRHPPHQHPPGPVYVNAAPRAASAKALGVTCAFFGMLAVIGAFAALCSGKLDIHIPTQALRALFSLGAGVVMFLLGTTLLGKSASPRP